VGTEFLNEDEDKYEDEDDFPWPGGLGFAKRLWPGTPLPP
jgi:hypothetical protein